jgi:Transglutaminase-like superfamily
MLRKLRRLTDLPLLERALVLQFTVLALGLRVALSVISLPRLTSLLSRTASSPILRRVPFFHTYHTTDRLVALSDLATTVSHGSGHCLPRSLLLFWVLRTQQHPVSLCLGISKNMTALEGHAWVEQDGLVFGDTRSFINGYTLMLRLPA